MATLDHTPGAPEATAVFLVGKVHAVKPEDVVDAISFSANSMKYLAEKRTMPRHGLTGGATRLASRSS